MAADLPAHLQAAAALLESQRAAMGDAAVDAALAALAASVVPAAPVGAARGADTAGAPQQLRQVAILFMDVVGSTQLSQALDPEDIQAVLDGLMQRCTLRIEAHGGRVLQYAGDCILAAFGSVQAQEDDVERALLAGLDLLALGQAEGKEVLRRFQHAGFDVRVGVHTGGVLLGGGVDAEGTIRGMAVNVAARLEQLAPPGALRISRETWLHVRGLFEMEEQPPLALKGVDEPVLTYLVQRALPRAFRDLRRGIQGLATPLVGRDAELALLLAARSDAAARGHLQAVTLTADAGLGKSRLLAEFERSLPPQVRCWRARAHPHSRGQVYGLVRDLFCRLCDIAESDDTTTAQARLQQGLAPVAGPLTEEAAAFIGQLIGLDFSASPHVAGILKDVRQIRSRAFHLAGELLCRAAAAQPAGLVLLLDDLHWADDASLDFFEALARHAAASPVLLLCGARPLLRDHRPAWGQALPQHQALELLPLADRGAALADALLARIQEPPQALRELLLRQADGNPFYMEELLQMLIDDGVIDARQQPWAVHLERLGALRVPTTLTGVLQARLDSLPAQERRALQQASVVGSIFWDGALRDADAPKDVSERTLQSLERRGPVRQRGDSAFAGNREYAFRHHLLHQVTYDTVLKRQREPLHRHTAQWLLAASGERIAEHAALIADHFERAGDTQEAVHYLRRAAQAADLVGAGALALEHASRALKLLPDDAWSERASLNKLRCNAFNNQGRRDEQATAVAESLRLAELLDNPRNRAVAHGDHALLMVVTGNHLACIESARMAQSWAERAGEPALALSSAADAGYALHCLGRYEESVALLQQTAAQARARGYRDVELIALNRTSSPYQALGRQKDRMDSFAQSIALADQLGNRRLSAGMRSNLGVAEMEWGNPDRAFELIHSGLAELRAIGDRGSQAYTLWGLAELNARAGRHTYALQAGEEALRLAEEARDQTLVHGLMLALVTMGAECGAFDKARTWLNLHDARAQDDAGRTPQSLLAGAVLCHRAGEPEAARREVLAWLHWLERPEGQVSDARPQALWQACTVLRGCGEEAAYERTLARAWRQLKTSADELPPERRHGFIHRVELHRQLAEAWAAAHPGEPAA